ncbi:MAG: chemotaxis protein CheR [Marinilabiliales bacterium]|nr:MAG: chemotaxis protein CheR [Marinilabiliales bacterium]
MIAKDLYGDLSDKDFKMISDYIYDNYGILLYPKKKLLVKSRLQNRIKVLQLKNYSEYCNYLINNKKESIEMIDRITTNKTDFFREVKHFYFLRDEIKKGFFDKIKSDKLKVWSAACSTGQEPYSLAMMLFDILKSEHYDFSINATDISKSVLEKAVLAIYPMALINQIPDNYIKKYLLKSKNNSEAKFRIAPEIRSKVEFSVHNLLDEKINLKHKFDIIFCRNTLIYFDRETQLKVINNLLSKLNNKGLLFLGHSESLINMDLELESVSPSVYKKIN